MDSLTNSDVEKLDDEDDPYAWLSRTAPTSPQLKRGDGARGSSKRMRRKKDIDGAADGESNGDAEDNKLSSMRVRLQDLHQHHHSWFETSSTSMEKLGGRIKKKVRYNFGAVIRNRSYFPSRRFVT